MLHYLKYVTLFLVLLMFFGCVSAPKVTLMSPPIGQIPNPLYTARPIDGSGMTFTWNYVQYVGIEDLDKSIYLVPRYFDRNKSHSITRKKTHSLQLVLRVFNPKHSDYTVFMNKRIEYSNGDEITNRMILGKSFLEFRQWMVPYPYNDRIKKMESSIEIHLEDGVVLLRTKTFKYSVN